MGRIEESLSKSSGLADKKLLITGGTGSFGTTMAAHALASGVEELRIFSRDEAKQDLMRHRVMDERVKFILGDTRDKESVNRATRGVDLVFHAAALKQVPSAEFFPLQAVQTNITGSANVLQSAVENQVGSVVCLSTDKAVYPINAMGMSKALMEKTAQAFARDFQDSETTISVTRYGNVMYSRGSVIPLFISQVKSGKPVTITDRSMTRFLMSLDESVDLVEFAFRHAKTGDLFIRKAPASTIEDLATAVIELFEGNVEQLHNIGFRHGEKLYESLLSLEELVKAEDHGNYYRVPLDSRDLNYSVFFDQGEDRPLGLEAYTSHNTKRLNVAEIKELLLKIPEVREELAR